MRKASVRLLRLNLGSEMGHALFRVLCALLFAAHLAFAWSLGWIAEVQGAVLGTAAFLAFALIWVVVVGASLLTFPARRMLSILLDQGIFALGIYLGGSAVAPMIWAPVLMAIGNALRNGPYYARLSSLSGAAFLAAAMGFSPFWRELPLVAEGIVLSVLILPRYTQRLSEQIAQAKREFKLRAARFESASRTDSLTGLLNRPGFFQALEELLGGLDNASAAAVMLLDLDGFKAINDTCGHGAGDAALRDIGARLSGCVCVDGRVARIGGDEFGIALERVASRDDAERLAQRLIEAVAAIRVPAAPGLRLGASIGICLLPDARFAGVSAVMEEADRLMYEAKRAGKNRFRVSGQTETGLCA